MKTSGENIMAIVKGLKTEEGEAAVSCPHPKKKLWLEIKEKINRGDIIRAPMKTSTKAQK
jgi:hypothetical protein